MAHYVGIRYDSSKAPFNAKREVFQHDGVLKADSMRPTYDAVIGPFRIKRGADYLAKHWYEPQCCTVAEAESLAIQNNVGTTIAVMLLEITFLLAAAVVVLEGHGGLVSSGWDGRVVHALLALVLIRALWREKAVLTS